MGYEEEAKELMKKFKLQFTQTQNQMQNVDLTEMYNKEDQNIKPQPVSQNDISNIVQSSNFSTDLPTDQSPIDNNSQNNISTDQSPPDQDISIVTNSIQPTPQSTTYTSPVNVPPGAIVCPECNTIHPPLKSGEKCPNAKQDVSKYGLDDISVNKFVVDIRNIVVSQLDKKEIKDGRKLFQFTIIELMKILEGYNE